MSDVYQIFVYFISGRGSVRWQRCETLCTSGLWITSYLHKMDTYAVNDVIALSWAG